MNDIESSIKGAMNRAGIPVPDDIFIDGKMHRFPTNNNRSDRSGYYKFFDHGTFIAGFYGDWRSGCKGNFCSKNEKELTFDEKQELKESKRKHEEVRRRMKEDEIKKARSLLDKAGPPDPNHNYLTAKGIEPVGYIKQDKNILLLPLTNVKQKLKGIQKISEKGEKKFTPGTDKTGSFLPIGQGDPFYICEGYATGASIYMAIRDQGQGSVIVAFDAGNLIHVGRALRDKYPAAEIIFCADNDQFKPGHKGKDNPGVTSATKAAKAIGAKLSIPYFKDTKKGPSDFNDLHRAEGLETVKKFLEKAEYIERKDVLNLVSLNDVQTETPRWLKKPYIPVGKITLLEGDPGIGKTFIALAVCAEVVSKGGTVFYASCEDGIADTLKPRVRQMRPDLNLERFFILSGIKKKDGTVVPYTVQDLDALKDGIEKYKPSLIVLDPLQGFLGAGMDFHKANETRARMAGIIKLAEEYSVSFLIVRHLNKGTKGKAIDRGIGSIDFSAMARSILLVGQKNGNKVVAHVKSSLAEKGNSLTFTIDKGVFYWTGETDISADELLADEAKESAIEKAKDFLYEVLSSGGVSSFEVEKKATSAGIKKRTLRRAKKELGVVAKEDRGEDGKIKGWVWTLPDSEPRIRWPNVGHLDTWTEHAENTTDSEPRTRWPNGYNKGGSCKGGLDKRDGESLVQTEKLKKNNILAKKPKDQSTYDEPLKEEKNPYNTKFGHLDTWTEHAENIDKFKGEPDGQPFGHLDTGEDEKNVAWVE